MKKLEMLKELNDKLKSFPFETTVAKEISKMNLDGISKQYKNAEDDIENAIVWSVNSLKNLLSNRPLRTLDENISYNESILKTSQTV